MLAWYIIWLEHVDFKYVTWYVSLWIVKYQLSKFFNREKQNFPTLNLVISMKVLMSWISVANQEEMFNIERSIYAMFGLPLQTSKSTCVPKKLYKYFALNVHLQLLNCKPNKSYIRGRVIFIYFFNHNHFNIFLTWDFLANILKELIIDEYNKA